MNGKVTRLQRITARPEPVEGQTMNLGNTPSSCGSKPSKRSNNWKTSVHSLCY